MRWLTLLLLAGCGTCPEPSIWDRYLWVTIVGLPSDTETAVLTYEADGEIWPCAVSFGPDAEGDDFAEVVDSDCAGAIEVGTYLSEWWIHYPEPRDRQITLTLETVDGSGAIAGFPAQEILPEWERRPFENGVCPGDRIGRVWLDAEGDWVRGP